MSKSGLSGLITPEKGNKLRIKPAMMKQLFSTAVKNTVEHVSRLQKIKTVSGAKTILMVGGLSEPKLFDSLKTSFTKLDIVVPAESALTVLKGTVMFGYNPAAITERMLNYTYGISLLPLFRDGVDPADKFIVDKNGGRRCKGHCLKIAECEQTIKSNQQIKSSDTIIPTVTTDIVFPLYASTTKSPRYVTDEGCFHVGTLKIDFKSDVPENLEKTFRICGYFGEPEIRIIAEDVDTAEQFSACFELPSK